MAEKQPPKLTPYQKWQIGVAYMAEYDKQLRQSQHEMCMANDRDPDRKLYTWDEFWQAYNKLWNAKQYEALALHCKMNYLKGFNRGKF